MMISAVDLIPKITDEVETLTILVEDTTSNVIAFALYRTFAEREAAARLLKEKLPPPIVEFTLSQTQKNPVALLEIVPKEPRACVFFYNLEDALPDVAGFLNFQRERFAEFPHVVLFWVREYGMKEMMERAPDFWSWSTRTFDFRSNQQLEITTNLAQSILAEPIQFRDRAELEQKIKLYQELLDEYGKQEHPDERFLAGLQSRLGRLFYHLGETVEAQGYYQQALNNCPDNEQEEKSSILHNLADLNVQLGHIDEAMHLYRELLDAEEHIGDVRGKAATLHNLAILYTQQGNIDEAMRLYRESLDTTERIGEMQGKAATLHAMAVVYAQQGRMDEAMRFYRESLDTQERIGDVKGKATTLHAIAGLYADQGKINEAMHLYRNSLETKERIGDVRGKAETLHEMAGLYAAQGNIDEAMRFNRESLDITERIGDVRGKAATLHQMAGLYTDQGNIDEAMRLYRESLNITERIGDMQGKAASLYNLSGLLMRKWDLENAVPYLQEAEKIYAYLKSPDVETVRETLSQAQMMAVLKNMLGEEGMQKLTAAIQSGDQETIQAILSTVQNPLEELHS